MNILTRRGGNKIAAHGPLLPDRQRLSEQQPDHDAPVAGRHQHQQDPADQGFRGQRRRTRRQEPDLVLGRLRGPGPLRLHDLRSSRTGPSSTTTASSSTPCPSPGTGSRRCSRRARRRGSARTPTSPSRKATTRRGRFRLGSPIFKFQDEQVFGNTLVPLGKVHLDQHGHLDEAHGRRDPAESRGPSTSPKAFYVPFSSAFGRSWDYSQVVRAKKRHAVRGHPFPGQPLRHGP